MDTLKPCPFCGGTPKTYRGMLNMQDGWWCIRCDACRFDGPYDLGESGAIERWNARPVEDALLEACERALQTQYELPWEHQRPLVIDHLVFALHLAWPKPGVKHDRRTS